MADASFSSSAENSKSAKLPWLHQGSCRYANLPSTNAASTGRMHGCLNLAGISTCIHQQHKGKLVLGHKRRRQTHGVVCTGAAPTSLRTAFKSATGMRFSARIAVPSWFAAPSNFTFSTRCRDVALTSSRTCAWGVRVVCVMCGVSVLGETHRSTSAKSERARVFAQVHTLQWSAMQHCAMYGSISQREQAREPRSRG